MSRTVTEFELDITPRRADTALVETSIRRALDALIGAEVNVIAVQSNDRTIQVTIVHEVRK